MICNVIKCEMYIHVLSQQGQIPSNLIIDISNLLVAILGVVVKDTLFEDSGEDTTVATIIVATSNGITLIATMREGESRSSKQGKESSNSASELHCACFKCAIKRER
ncbi:hypothetical protein BDB00DRAFT_798190 [Zychaea mexicana]|uniref:uncharacterized protein n=1 Tax=Zychaea mexicana TaxID=64656 RepID=UPI0022FE5DDB|nr:uncharacterized protein BDB00DRAFT_798190 [Zychaea mexicana]KAI9499070.1 hypothetical protein BDB00DRAFT_798190 [Zychaea mexicana]